MFNFLRSAPPGCDYCGPTVSLRSPGWSDQKAWLALRARSRTFLEPWEPAWSEDALTPAAFKRRMYRITREWRSGTGYAFFIFHNETGEMVGGLTFANVRYGVVKSANIGYWTGVSHTRKGYMTEAIQIGLDFAFNELGLHRIEAACLLHNIPSRSLLLKSGFQPEGQARKYLCIAGRWQDHDTFGLLCSDITGFVPVIKKGSAK